MVEIGSVNLMRGISLKEWRKRHRYSQKALMLELEVKSRQTISTWENSNNELPRIVQLAICALENVPEVRKVGGLQASAAEERRWKNNVTNHS